MTSADRGRDDTPGPMALLEMIHSAAGDPFTADDVKVSFERYRGTSAKLLHDRVKSVQVIDPRRVRFALHKPWPDFLVFYDEEIRLKKR